MSSIRTRQERDRVILDLYNQGKTIREIAKEVRMSFRDIGAILNKTVEEKAGGKNNKMMLRNIANRNNNNTYLYPPKPTNSFLIERLH
jgi:Mor family transcriptional regulator